MLGVSCVIPYFDGADTIGRAIDSAVSDPACTELIIVVDASPARLRLTGAHRDLRESGRLRVIELASNHGQGAARNIGAALAVGDLIVFLDQDDAHIDGYLTFAARFLDAHPEIIALEVGAEFWRDERIILDESDPRYAQSLNSVPWNIVIRRPAFWAVGGFPVSSEFRTPAAGEDIAFRMALRRSFTVARSEAKLVRHFIRPDSATDRYLRRTRVVAGRVEFLSSYEHESDGLLRTAIDIHTERVARGLDALRTAK